MDHNPIYQQLTRHLRSPELKAFNPLIGGIALSGSIGMFVLIVISQQMIWVAVLTNVLSVLMASVALIAPVVTLVVTSLIIGRHAAQDNLVLVQLTGVTPYQIVDGYYDGARQHLRWLHAIGVGLVPPLWLVLFFATGGFNLLSCFQVPQCSAGEIIGFLLSGLFMASVAVGIIAAIGVNLSTLALGVGIWLGLTQGNNAMLGAGGVIAGAVVACIAIYAAIFLTIPFGLCASILVLPLIIFGAPPFSDSMRRRNYDAAQRIQSIPDAQ